MARVFAREGAKVVISDMKHREKEGLETVKQLDSIGGPVGWHSTFECLHGTDGPEFLSGNGDVARSGCYQGARVEIHHRANRSQVRAPGRAM
jgi:hypothetical protein